MFVRICFAAALAVTGATAFAQQAAQPAPAAPADDKKVCRAMTPTGSILSKRVCKSRSEWAKIHEQNERDNQRFRDRPVGAGSTSAE